MSTSPAAFSPLAPPVRWWAMYVSGDLDLLSARALDARLGRALALHDGDGLVLDLSLVPFMDCSGLRPVLRVRNRLAGRLALRGVQRRVAHLLQVAQVADTLRILTPPNHWPTEADPQQCRVVLDDLLDHRPARTDPDLRRPATRPTDPWP